MRLYLDSSALVKLVQRETESDALRAYLRTHRDDERATCELARVEVVRAVAEGGPDAVVQARAQLARLHQLPLHRALLDQAAVTGSPVLRSLDAVHLAAARRLGDGLRAVVTYDARMAAAAEDAGLAVVAPA